MAAGIALDHVPTSAIAVVAAEGLSSDCGCEGNEQHGAEDCGLECEHG